MTMRNSSLTLLLAGLAAALASAPTPAQQTTPVAANELGEVIVTARQRAEKLSDVPVTIQAFTAADIKTAGIERPQDFIALTPGLSVVQTAEIGDIQISIRGINTGRDAETNFAFVVDGVLQTNPAALNQELNSVTQIEVLKGPQGALYGRNAVAGAMIMTTRKPTDQFEADVGLGGGSAALKKGDLWISGPLGDAVKASISGYFRKTDGQWSNSFLKCDDCVDYLDEKGGQVRALFDVGGGTLDFKGKYSKVSSGAINFNGSLALQEAASALNFPPFSENPNTQQFFYINDIKPTNNQRNIDFSLKGEWKLGLGTLTSYVAHNDQTNEFLTDGASSFFQYFGTASCQNSYAARKIDTPLPAPWGYGASLGGAGNVLPPYDATTCGGYQYQQRDQKDTSVEVRLTSPGDQPLRWLAGVYYADVSRHVVVSTGEDNQTGYLSQAFVPTSGPNPTDLLYDDTFHSKVVAGFGQIAYDVDPAVEVALALRYDREKRSVDNNVPVCSAGNPTACRAQTPGYLNFITGGVPYINPAYQADPTLATNGIPSRDKTYSQLQPKLSVNWKLADGWSLFGSYGYGFRSGGFNSSGSAATVQQYFGGLCLGPSQFLTVPQPGLYPATCTATSVHNITGVNDDYKRELSKAAELGFKALLLDRSLSITGALYRTKVEDMQFFNFFAGPFGILRVVSNLDEATIKGVELDSKWKPNRYLTLFAGYAYTDSTIDQYSGRPYTAGNKVPYAPLYTANAGAELTVPVTGTSLQFVARVDLTAVGETWFSPVQRNALPNLFGLYAGYGQGDFSNQKRDPYHLINARLALQSDVWSVTAWGHNLADKHYLAEVIPAPEFGGSFVHEAPGRSYGLDLAYHFGKGH
jgi:iron complex outermembrane recepter protein